MHFFKKAQLFAVMIFLFSFPNPIQAQVNCEQIYQTNYGHSFYEINPTYTDPVDTDSNFEFSTPKAEGMKSYKLRYAARRLRRKKFMRSFMVIRNNKIVMEKYFNGSDKTKSNNIHSASKSMLSALVGIAIEQGHISGLDQKISDLLPKQYSNISDEKKQQISVGNLLTMTAGIDWTEDSSEYIIEKSSDWVKQIISLPMTDAPGENFHYNTGLTHLLSAIISESTGMSTCEFAHKELFNPLGITAEHWGRDPQGYFSGGYNLYLTPRELAKFAMLYQNNGQNDGQQIVPRRWIASSTSHQIEEGEYGYGYLWWLKKISGYDVKIAWGYGGQLIYIIPKLDTIVVMTTDTSNTKSVNFDGHSIIRRYIIPSIM